MIRTNKKGMSIMVFLIFALGFMVMVYILSGMVLDNLKFNRIAGEDASKITTIKQASYRQIFEVNQIANFIFKDDFFSIKRDPQLDNKILITAEGNSITSDAEEIFNKKYETKAIEYNSFVTNENMPKGGDHLSYLLDSSIKYNFYFKDNFLYGFASKPRILKIGATRYGFWPNFKIKSEVFNDIIVLTLAKKEFIKCLKDETGSEDISFVLENGNLPTIGELPTFYSFSTDGSSSDDGSVINSDTATSNQNLVQTVSVESSTLDYRVKCIDITKNLLAITKNNFDSEIDASYVIDNSLEFKDGYLYYKDFVISVN